MKMWADIKKRLSKSRMKIAKQKAVAWIELVGAGAALTGGSILMEKMLESPPGSQAGIITYILLTLAPAL